MFLEKNEANVRSMCSPVAACQPDDSQVSVWKTARRLPDGLLGRGRAVVESSEELLVWRRGGGGVERKHCTEGILS